MLALILTPIMASAQIKVDDVGDGWKLKVDSAIQLIKQVSPDAGAVLDSNVDRVEFWLGDRSSTRPDRNGGKGTILIAVDEIPLGIYNIAAVLVHESLHLHFNRIKFKLDPKQEELTAYCWELLFLIQIPNCPTWLIQNAEFQIRTLSPKKE